MAAPKPDPLLEGPTLLKARWKTTKQIGAGAFGEIYRGVDVLTQQEVAVKVEKVNSKKQVLRLEVAVLKKMQSSEYVCRFIYCGRHSNVNYLVMQLLGRNLSELRREQAGGKLSLSTACRLGIQMLRSIEDVHEAGYLHRDVKPSNFAIGLDQFHDTCFIIDFGLARRYVLSNGEVRPPRESTGFRGTARYASINSHLGNELARRDDLWSLVYVMVEFTRGQLPWRRIKEKEHIGEYKQRIPMLELLDGLPVELWDIVQHVESLQYADRPDYDYVVECLETICRKIHAPPDDKYDWERTPAEKVAAHQVLTLYDVACVNYEPPSPRNSTDAQLLLAPDSGGGNQLNVPGGNMYSMGSLASNSTRAQSRGMTTEMSSMFMSGGSYVFEKDGENGIFDSYGNLQGTPTGSGIGAHRMSGSSLGTGVGLDSNDPGHTPMPGLPEHPDGGNPAAGGGPTGAGAGEVAGDQEVGGEGGTRNKTETEDDSGSVCKCVIL